MPNKIVIEPSYARTHDMIPIGIFSTVERYIEVLCEMLGTITAFSIGGIVGEFEMTLGEFAAIHKTLRISQMQINRFEWELKLLSDFAMDPFLEKIWSKEEFERFKELRGKRLTTLLDPKYDPLRGLKEAAK